MGRIMACDPETCEVHVEFDQALEGVLAEFAPAGVALVHAVDTLRQPIRFLEREADDRARDAHARAHCQLPDHVATALLYQLVHLADGIIGYFFLQLLNHIHVMKNLHQLLLCNLILKNGNL